VVLPRTLPSPARIGANGAALRKKAIFKVCRAVRGQQPERDAILAEDELCHMVMHHACGWGRLRRLNDGLATTVLGP
jgi:hypothetical protein